MEKRNGNAGLNLRVSLEEADLIRFALEHIPLYVSQDDDMRKKMVTVLETIVPYKDGETVRLA